MGTPDRQQQLPGTLGSKITVAGYRGVSSSSKLSNIGIVSLD
jgi:hypothetical protein